MKLIEPQLMKSPYNWVAIMLMAAFAFLGFAIVNPYGED